VLNLPQILLKEIHVLRLIEIRNEPRGHIEYVDLIFILSNGVESSCKESINQDLVLQKFFFSFNELLSYVTLILLSLEPS